MPRQKDGFTRSEKWKDTIFRFPRTAAHWEADVDFLQSKLDEGYPGRIYSTYNARDLMKGLRNLTERCVEAMFTRDAGFMLRSKSVMSSCLSKRGTIHKKEYFMLDIDTDDIRVVDKVKNIAQVGDTRGEDMYVDVFKTKNGYHMFVKPMDVRLFDGIEDVEVKNDEYVCVSW